MSEATQGIKPTTGYAIRGRFITPVHYDRPMHTHPQVYFVEPEIDIFTEIQAVLWYGSGKYIFINQGFGCGLEHEVRDKFEAKEDVSSLDSIQGTPPILRRVYRWEVDILADIKERRKKEEEQAKAEEIERERIKRVATFEGAVTEALQSVNAELVSVRNNTVNNEEAIVRYRCDGESYECVVRKSTLGIVDPGICLVDHDTGETYGGRLTIRAMPGVIRQANRLGRLVVWR